MEVLEKRSLAEGELTYGGLKVHYSASLVYFLGRVQPEIHVLHDQGDRVEKRSVENAILRQILIDLMEAI